MRRIWHNNSLSIVLLALALFCIGGEAVAGWIRDSDERAAHNEQLQSFGAYLRDPTFLEAAAENWESSFLNLAALVWLTTFLHQKGSPFSKDPDAPTEEVDRAPDPHRAGAPASVRRGGWRLMLYQRSLLLGLVLLFLGTFLIHASASYHLFTKASLAAGDPPPRSFVRYLGNAQLWFEAFQNWQSEFIGAFAIVILSIFLRERGSPESKPVDAPHGQTGRRPDADESRSA
jgi:uncharacterized membrane protein